MPTPFNASITSTDLENLIRSIADQAAAVAVSPVVTRVNTLETTATDHESRITSLENATPAEPTPTEPTPEEPAPEPEPTTPTGSATRTATGLIFDGVVPGYTDVTLRVSGSPITTQEGWYYYGYPAADGTVQIEANEQPDETATYYWQIEDYADRSVVLVAGQVGAYTTTTPTEPTPEPVGYTANSSGGGGALPGDYLNLSWTGTTSSGSKTSGYHLYTNHLSLTEPVGVIFHLHGDGGYEYDTPSYAVTQDYLQVARDNNMILVVPKTPNPNETWWTDAYAHEWLATLFDRIIARHDVDLNRVYWSGYSGGAEVIANSVIPNYFSKWTGGGAQMLGGGNWYSYGTPSFPQAFKDHFPLRWVTGSDDDGSTSSDGFDALAAAQSGKSRYANLGFTTSQFIVNGDDHYESANDGPPRLREFISNTLWK